MHKCICSKLYNENVIMVYGYWWQCVELVTMEFAYEKGYVRNKQSSGHLINFVKKKNKSNPFNSIGYKLFQKATSKETTNKQAINTSPPPSCVNYLGRALF